MPLRKAISLICKMFSLLVTKCTLTYIKCSAAQGNAPYDTTYVHIEASHQPSHGTEDANYTIGYYMTKIVPANNSAPT